VVKNLTESVRYKQVELENQFNELLTATVSHEMRTPLNSILTLLLAIRQYLAGSPRGEELWGILQSSSTIL
jgi:signal transduction histidine kinase